MAQTLQGDCSSLQRQSPRGKQILKKKKYLKLKKKKKQLLYFCLFALFIVEAKPPQWPPEPAGTCLISPGGQGPARCLLSSDEFLLPLEHCEWAMAKPRLALGTQYLLSQ